MKLHIGFGCFAFILLSAFAEPSFSQSGTTDTAAAQVKKHKQGLFDKEDPIKISIIGNVKDLINDRGDKPVLHAMQLAVENDEGTKDTIPSDIKTRGHFRKMSENCTYPPLLLTFKSDSTKKKLPIEKEGNLKLVVPCVDDNYIVREYLVYKIYNILTPFSLKARLARFTMYDTKKSKAYNEMYGILIENEKKMAKRNQQTIIKRKLSPESLEQETYLRMAMFQYMVGNTDWSIQFQQNIILMVAQGGTQPYCVAYDFDHSGMVEAPYAQPAEALEMSSVTERRYRGYCIPDITVYDPYIKQFNEAKTEIYSLYQNCKYIDDKYRANIIKYLDKFYETINNPAAFKKDFLYPCDKNGTGNVIIKGLQKD
jgi:hypothetical protein